jgi:hypothetical protein
MRYVCLSFDKSETWLALTVVLCFCARLDGAHTLGLSSRELPYLQQLLSVLELLQFFVTSTNNQAKALVREARDPPIVMLLYQVHY